MDFKNWLEMSSLRDLLKDVPQGAKYHPEGPVFKHMRMVRKALDTAVELFNRARETDPLFATLSPVTAQERNVLRIAAWLHDVGKASATTWTSPYGEVLPWKDAQSPQDGKWSSIGHEDPEHYEPILKKMQGPWPQMYRNAPAEDRDLVMFLIQKHMGHWGDSYSRWFIHIIMDERGQLRTDRTAKLLIIFKMMDLIGRANVEVGDAVDFLANIKKSAGQRQAYWEKEAEKRLPVGREEFIEKLQKKGLSATQIRDAVKGKFGD